MSECYFCKDPLIELTPVEKISGTWTETSKFGSNVEWSCQYCLNKQTKDQITYE